MPSQEELNRLFEYNKETGDLIRRTKTRRGSIGSVVSPRHTTIYGKDYPTARIIWHLCGRAIPHGMEIDHIDHNPRNNRLVNLRAVTHKENARNRGTFTSSPTGIVGVRWRTTRGRQGSWQAIIKVDGKQIYFGDYRHISTAIFARKIANQLYGFHPNHGDKRVVNS
jgi:hypothetical protein